MPSKYFFRGGTFDKTQSNAWAACTHIDDQGVFKTSVDSLVEKSLPLVDVQIITGNLTLTAGDNGKVIGCNSAAGNTITLPKANLGKLKFVFSLLVSGTSNQVRIVPQSTDGITGNQFNTTINKYIQNPSATDAAGDFVELVSDGSTLWYISRIKGTWTKES